jgi:hypothetical protein
MWILHFPKVFYFSFAIHQWNIIIHSFYFDAVWGWKTYFEWTNFESVLDSISLGKWKTSTALLWFSNNLAKHIFPLLFGVVHKWRHAYVTFSLLLWLQYCRHKIIDLLSQDRDVNQERPLYGYNYVFTLFFEYAKMWSPYKLIPLSCWGSDPGRSKETIVRSHKATPTRPPVLYPLPFAVAPPILRCNLKKSIICFSKCLLAQNLR